MHGFNSLGTWPQLLAKGTRWLKVDLGLATEASCRAFSTLGQPGRGSTADCFSQSGGRYCCLAMSGDTGSRPNLLDPFNTTYDLVALLEDAAMQALLPHGPNAPLPQLLIGLDFGGSPSACLSGCPAASLTRAFLHAAAAAMAANNLSIAFALDSGIAGWYAELDAACAAPGGCSAEDQALAALPWIAQGGASSWPSSARTRILNDDYTSFQRCCASDCWSSATPATQDFPWLWYEQTGQADYLKMLGWWASCAALPPHRRADPNTQLNLVSNEAPEMAEVFSAPSGLLGRGLNAPMPGSSGLTLPLTLAVPLTPAAPSERALVLAAALGQGRGGGVGLWSLPHTGAAAPGSLQAALDSATLPHLLAPPVALAAASIVGMDASSSSSSSSSTAPQLLLLGTEDGTLACGALQPTTGAFLPFAACSGGWCTWSLALEGNATLLSAALLCTQEAPAALPAHAANLSGNCTVAALVGLGAGGAEVRLWPLGSSGSAAVTAAARVAAAELVVDKGAGLALLWEGGASGSVWQGVAVLAARGSIGAASEGQYVNNADMSHCLLPLPSSDEDLFYSAFQTVPYTLQYDYAPLAAWQALALNTLPYPHLGICNPSITHGKFELGASGAAALFPWLVTEPLPQGGNSSAQLEVGILVAHEPAPPGTVTAPQWLLCGLPTTKEGLVWSSFQLSPPPF